MAKKKKSFSKKQLDVLYDCWKDADNYKDRLVLIEQRLPGVPSLAALSVMRKLAKTDTKWLKMATRKKNQQEKEKLNKKQEKEEKKKEKEKRKLEKQQKREEKLKVEKSKNKLNKIKGTLNRSHTEELEKRIEPEFFFCGTLQHFVNNISCIYRIFSKEDGFVLDPQCEKCSKLNKYIPIIEEVIENARKEIRRDKTPKGRGKDEKQTKASGRKKKSRGNN